MVRKNFISSISELQQAISDALRALPRLKERGQLPVELEALLRIAPPPDLAAEVSLRHVENDRQIKSTAATASWSPEVCGVWIEYVPDEIGPDSVASQDEPDRRALEDLIRLLDQAERMPQMKFVSWTWFRDQYLPKHGWLSSKEPTQRMLESAVGAGVVLTGKTPNPKQPDFPVTTLQLNRQHPVVRDTTTRVGLPSRFKPVAITGKPLSETIIEDRR